MTLPEDRTRAAVWASGLRIKIARDTRLPLELRKRAVVITRHFPTLEEITSMTRKPATRKRHSKVSAAPGRTLPADYSHWLATIKTNAAAARYRAALAANAELVQLYWQIGREILDRQTQQGWGTKVIDKLALDLHAAFGMKGFSPRNLRYMRDFAQAWPNAEIWQKSVAKLPWGHNVLLLTMLKDPAERLRYAEQAVVGGWSRSTLEANIRDKLGKRRNKTT